MFSLNEKVVYPGHGVALINRIIERKVAGTMTRFFELKFLHKDMTILVPVHNMISVGIRPLSSRQNINEVLKLLEQPVTPIHQEVVANWNKRKINMKNYVRVLMKF